MPSHSILAYSLTPSRCIGSIEALVAPVARFSRLGRYLQREYVVGHATVQQLPKGISVHISKHRIRRLGECALHSQLLGMQGKQAVIL